MLHSGLSGLSNSKLKDLPAERWHQKKLKFTYKGEIAFLTVCQSRLGSVEQTQQMSQSCNALSCLQWPTQHKSTKQVGNNLYIKNYLWKTQINLSIWNLRCARNKRRKHVQSKLAGHLQITGTITQVLGSLTKNIWWAKSYKFPNIYWKAKKNRHHSKVLVHARCLCDRQFQMLYYRSTSTFRRQCFNSSTQVEE